MASLTLVANREVDRRGVLNRARMTVKSGGNHNEKSPYGAVPGPVLIRCNSQLLE
jgi:hypothetical protein